MLITLIAVCLFVGGLFAILRFSSGVDTDVAVTITLIATVVAGAVIGAILALASL